MDKLPSLNQFYGFCVCGLYNNVRLHGAIGFVTPMNMLAGRQKEIQAVRDRKLEEARQKRQLPASRRHSQRFRGELTIILPGETEAGSAGMHPCRGIARWAYRNDAGERGKITLRALPNDTSDR